MCFRIVDLLKWAVIVAKPFQTGVYILVIHMFVHVPVHLRSKGLVLSSSMFTSWSKLHPHLIICFVRWHRNAFQRCVGKGRPFPWIREAAVTCTRNISVGVFTYVESCVQSISGALQCAEGMGGWMDGRLPASGKTKKSKLGTLNVFKAWMLMLGFSGFSS